MHDRSTFHRSRRKKKKKNLGLEDTYPTKRKIFLPKLTREYVESETQAYLLEEETAYLIRILDEAGVLSRNDNVSSYETIDTPYKSVSIPLVVIDDSNRPSPVRTEVPSRIESIKSHLQVTTSNQFKSAFEAKLKNYTSNDFESMNRPKLNRSINAIFISPPETSRSIISNELPISQNKFKSIPSGPPTHRTTTASSGDSSSISTYHRRKETINQKKGDIKLPSIRHRRKQSASIWGKNNKGDSLGDYFDNQSTFQVIELSDNDVPPELM